MEENTLPTISGTGTQNTTQDPQTAGANTGAGTPTSTVQPGATGSLDTATGGVPLISQQLSTVTLVPSNETRTAPAVTPEGLNPGVVIAAILLFVVAAGLIVGLFLPAKNTTD